MTVGTEMEVIDKFELTVSWARSLTRNPKPSPHQYFLRWMRNSRLELPVLTCSVSADLVVNGKLTYFPFWRCLTVMLKSLATVKCAWNSFILRDSNGFVLEKMAPTSKLPSIMCKLHLQHLEGNVGKGTFILHHWYRLQTKVTVHHIRSILNFINLILSKSSSPHVHDSIL